MWEIKIVHTSNVEKLETKLQKLMDEGWEPVWETFSDTYDLLIILRRWKGDD